MEFSIIQPKKTAVLVDLSFFLERYNTHKSIKTMEAKELAKRLKDYVWETLRRNEDYLHRVYIYDCEPLGESHSLIEASASQLKPSNLS